MATFWVGAARSVICMFSLYFDIVILVISHFGFMGRPFGLNKSVPGHCLFVTFHL